jgi:Icc-related predicted phosphoesterase
MESKKTDNKRQGDEPKIKGLKILAASDFHGSHKVAESLARKAEMENVDLIILAGDLHDGQRANPGIIAPFKKRNQRVIFVPGNWDTTAEANALKKAYEINNIDGAYTHYNGVDIIGVGSPDFRLDIDDEKTLDKLVKNFEKVKDRKTKKILVSHIHARGTLAEFSGIPGSEILRGVIDYFHPDFFIAAHIHEAEGLEQKIGKTKVLQVGKKGRIIEIK